MSGSKKSKKSLKTSNYVLDTDDEIAKAKRARRFEREHEIERQRARSGGVGFQVESEPSFSPYNHHTGHITQGVHALSLEPGYDPVRSEKVRCTPRMLTLDFQNVIDWDRYTIVGRSNNLFKDYLRLTTVGVPRGLQSPN